MSGRPGDRLSARTIVQHDPAALAGRPLPTSGAVCEDCTPVGPDTVGIVHLGTDGFMRAHLATYAEDLLASGWPGRIHLVSLGDDDAGTRLSPQDHLYSLTAADAEHVDDPRIMTSLARVSTGWEAAIEAIASPATRMVTLTVGSAAYQGPHDDWDPTFDTSEDDVPPTVPEVIARGLGRRDRDLPPPVIAPLDDVFMNGETLRMLVLDAAGRIDEGLEEWIEIEVEFPNSVIDRLVAEPTGPTLDEIERRLGFSDEAALVTERHRSWVIESVEGLPPLADVGVELTRSIVPFERRRLWLFEGPRLALSTAGALCGCTTVAEAAVHPVAGAFAARISRSAAAVMLMAAGGEPDGAEPGTTEALATAILTRLANPTVTAGCVDVCAGGSRTIPMAILPVADGLLIAGLGVGDHAMAVASWLALTAGLEIDGKVVGPVDDPLAGYLYAAMSNDGPEALVLDALAEMVVPDLPGFAAEILVQLHHLMDMGTAAFGLHGSSTSGDAAVIP